MECVFISLLLASCLLLLVTCFLLPASRLRHIEHNPGHREGDDERGPAVAHERERDAGEWEDAGDGGHVDERLQSDERYESAHEEPPEHVRGATRDHDPPDEEREIRRDKDDAAEESELLDDDGKYRIPQRLGEVVMFLDALAESPAPEAAGADGDLGLVRMIPGTLERRFGVEEHEDAIRAIGLDRDERRDRRKRDDPKEHDLGNAASPEEVDKDRRPAGDDERTEVLLLRQEPADSAEDDEKRNKGCRKSAELPALFLKPAR